MESQRVESGIHLLDGKKYYYNLTYYKEINQFLHFRYVGNLCFTSISYKECPVFEFDSYSLPMPDAKSHDWSFWKRKRNKVLAADRCPKRRRRSRIRLWHIFQDKNVGMCHFWNDMGNLPLFFKNIIILVFFFGFS